MFPPPAIFLDSCRRRGSRPPNTRVVILWYFYLQENSGSDMNKANNWPNKKRGGNEAGHVGRGRRNGRGSGKKQNHSRSEGGEKHFPKFVDTNKMNNEPNYWPNNDWNCDNRNTNYLGNGSIPATGIYPWIRKKPNNPLILPHHINFEQHEHQEAMSKNKSANETPQVEKLSVSQKRDEKMNVSKTGNDCSKINPVSDRVEVLKLPTETNISVKIKQEKDVLINLQQQKKSSSSSSSSSSESSSSEEEPESKIKQADPIKGELTPSSRLPSAPLNIKLKPKTNSVSSTPVKIPQILEAMTECSPKSYCDGELTAHVPVNANKMEKLQVPKNEAKTKSTKEKNSSEDDVVCIGKLENKIILDDEEDDEETHRKNPIKTKKSVKKTTAEKCMICDKKGHTSFQCQMICKNCSEPYHGYRTCPHPANLNTMMQLFIEFCMQQFQNFNVEKQIAPNPCDSFPKPQFDSQHLASSSNKSFKRKQAKANETKTKSFKKRKISASKKTKSKSDSDDSSDDSDDDNNDDDTDSETSSTESEEDISDSSAETLVSSKKKRKIKGKNASKAALSLSKFSTNPVNLPMVLNGFPNLTVPTTSIQNTNTSTNALNTLLLTQMFQNAIGALKQ